MHNRHQGPAPMSHSECPAPKLAELPRGFRKPGVFLMEENINVNSQS